MRLSKALVASSKIKILGFKTKEREINNRCLCPPERLVPPSDITVCIPMGICSISWAKPAILAASQASSIVTNAPLEIFSKIEELLIRPFCKTTPNCRRIAQISNPDKSCPS